MKNLILLFVLTIMSTCLMGQRPKNTEVTAKADLPVCSAVIDYLSPKRQLMSMVWEGNSAVAAAKTTGKTTFQVFDANNVLLTGWEVCTAINCKHAQIWDQDGKPTEVSRKDRKKVGDKILNDNTHVIDLTTFGGGTYKIKMTCGSSVAETTIEIPNNGLAKPQPLPASPDLKKKMD